METHLLPDYIFQMKQCSMILSQSNKQRFGEKCEQVTSLKKKSGLTWGIMIVERKIWPT